MAQNAYERTGTKAQRENDLGLAHHAFRKAGRNGKADEIEKKAQRLKEINQRRIEKNAEFRRMHPTQIRSMNDFEAYSIDTASKTRLHNPVIFK
jgi:ATP-dependent protease ClpP protease subunit